MDADAIQQVNRAVARASLGEQLENPDDSEGGTTPASEQTSNTNPHESAEKKLKVTAVAESEPCAIRSWAGGGTDTAFYYYWMGQEKEKE